MNKPFTEKGNTKEDYEELKRMAKRAEKMAKDFMKTPIPDWESGGRSDAI